MNDDLGCVYFINMTGTNYLKIGYTYNLQKRLRHLQNNVPQPLIVIGQDWTQQPQPLERAYHHFLKPYRLTSGEWFNIPNMIEVISKYRNMFAKIFNVHSDTIQYLEFNE